GAVRPEPEEVDPGRGQPARHAGVGPGFTRARLADGPRPRLAAGRARDRPGVPAAPAYPHLRGSGCGRDGGQGDRRDPETGRGPMPGAYVSLDERAARGGQARGFSFLPRQPVRSLLAGRLASRLRGRGLNFEEIRPYQPGDDVRQIDWKVTARTRKT